LIQTALEQSEAPKYLQYIDYIIVWGNTSEEVFEREKNNTDSFESWFCHKPKQDQRTCTGDPVFRSKMAVPMDVINKITAVSPPTEKKKHKLS